MTTMTITEFLLARISEDESMAERAGSFTPWSDTFQNDNYGHLTVQPDRIVAECKAKRQIIDEHTLEEYDGHPSCWLCAPEFSWGKEPTKNEQPCRTLRALATVYAEHPDHRPEWRP